MAADVHEPPAGPPLAGLTVLAAPASAEAGLRVFACVPEWGVLAEAIGGDTPVAQLGEGQSGHQAALRVGHQVDRRGGVGRQHLLDGLKGPEHHAVAHAD